MIILYAKVGSSALGRRTLLPPDVIYVFFLSFFWIFDWRPSKEGRMDGSRWWPVWPDAGIESGRILPKSCPKVAKAVFLFKSDIFIIAQKLVNIWATFVQ